MTISTITKETKRQSYDEIKNGLGKRQSEVHAFLLEYTDGSTASELAIDMWDKGIFDLPDRNNVHPRLNELVEFNLVEITGKRKCTVTGKTVAVYKTKGL